MNADVEKLVVLQAIDLEMVHLQSLPALAAKSVAEGRKRLAETEAAVGKLQAELTNEESMRRRTPAGAA